MLNININYFDDQTKKSEGFFFEGILELVENCCCECVAGPVPAAPCRPPHVRAAGDPPPARLPARQGHPHEEFDEKFSDKFEAGLSRLPERRSHSINLPRTLREYF